MTGSLVYSPSERVGGKGREQCRHGGVSDQRSLEGAVITTRLLSTTNSTCSNTRVIGKGGGPED